MAACAGIHLGMKGVAKNCLCYGCRLIGQFWTTVTAAALVDAKEFFAVMAESARCPFLHLSHGCYRIFASLIQFGVAD